MFVDVNGVRYNFNGPHTVIDNDGNRVTVSIPQTYAQSSIPFIWAPTGTMANNGAITLGTALATTYANCYVLLPAGAIASGIPSASTFYFCQMSSTTAGTVFNNPYFSGVPVIPANPVSFTTTGPGAYTGVTGVFTGPFISVSGGLIGPNGLLNPSGSYSIINNANNKICSMAFGGTTFHSITGTTSTSESFSKNICNRGAFNSQVSMMPQGSAIYTNGGGALLYASIDTTQSQNVSYNGNLATATDYIVLESFSISILYS